MEQMQGTDAVFLFHAEVEIPQKTENTCKGNDIICYI